ncbi:hypothetical protein R3P38DRAFT_2861023 [Favolaschia claudopus]|uniref:F-box domain-containing protein n=1 Tax=Favolaschia claudopus TaxID=2862362 RepID=A0AAW0DLV3_9AGAR
MVRRSNGSIDREADVVDAQLQILRAREADFERILADMQRLKVSVTVERLALEVKRKELHKERQPINWLPPELLIHIFVTYTEADSESHSSAEVYHRAPVIISHVCSSWRSISLSTSQMWRRISFQSLSWNARPIVAFLARSGKVPLDIVFIPPESTSVVDESRRAERLLSHLAHDIRRIRSIAFQSRAAAMQRLVAVLTDPDNQFSSLRDLELSLVSLEFPIQSLPSLIPSTFQGSGTMMNLIYLRLVKLPPFNIPKHFLPNLKALELGFPPKKATSEGPGSYMLRMSQLLRFLNCTPKLQELVLTNTVPFMDVYLNGEEVVHTTTRNLPMDPIELLHLDILDWTYPFGPDVHHVLSFFHVPALRKVFIGVEEYPVPTANVFLLRGYSVTVTSQLFGSNRVLELSSLRDLTLECRHQDTIGSLLRRFSFPVLETLEITHVDGSARHAASRDQLPTFPRLESMFRDPRLPLLTHLTICRFQISAEFGKAEAMLGYIPALVSLTLDGCGGVERLLEGLRQPASVAVGGHVCPRLEALALIRCADVRIHSLLELVEVRNGGSSETKIGGSAKNRVAGRAIRPMKKLRRHGHNGPVPDISLAQVPSSLVGHECRSIPISYVRLAYCALIRQEEARTLQLLGVADVIWSSG